MTSSKNVRAVVAQKLAWFQRGNANRVRAELAILRRGMGKNMDEAPETWRVVLALLPEDMMGKSQFISPAESAVFNALTLFAMTMSGKDIRNNSTHQAGKSLGAAAAEFTIQTEGLDEEGKSRILPRLRRLIAADSVEEAAVPLRNVVQLLNQKSIGMDFALLAQDLCFYSTPNGRAGVRLNWARDYYSRMNREETARRRQTATAGKAKSK